MMKKLLRFIFLNIIGIFKKPSNSVHIINSHFITKNFYQEKDEDLFRKFLFNISKIAEIISIQDAVKLINQKKSNYSKAYVAFTFDDGFKECIKIASILDEFNCKAAFFINSNYIESNTAYQKSFNSRVGLKTKEPMSWKDVKNLHKNGHIIGSHGLDHLDFGTLDSKSINSQLKVNKDILEKKIGYNCDYFAWTYGKFNNFSEHSLDLCLQYHKVIFSSTNFKKYFSYDNKVINRRHLEPFWSYNEIKYFLSFKKI